MVLGNSVFYTQRNFFENYSQFGYVASKFCPSWPRMKNCKEDQSAHMSRAGRAYTSTPLSVTVMAYYGGPSPLPNYAWFKFFTVEFSNCNIFSCLNCARTLLQLCLVLSKRYKSVYKYLSLSICFSSHINCKVIALYACICTYTHICIHK